MQLYSIKVQPGIAHQSIVVQLSGKTYTIFLKWNDRVKVWEGNLYDINGDMIIGTKLMHIDVDILGQARSKPNCPPGALGFSSSTPGLKPDYNNIGGQVKLYYLDPA
jgi:hypothetical protein